MPIIQVGPMYSQAFLKVEDRGRRKSDGDVTITESCTNVGFEDQGMRPQSKETEHSLQSMKARNGFSPISSVRNTALPTPAC